MDIELKCINCDNNFIAEYKHRDKKYCSRSCYFEFANKNKTIGRKKDESIREVRKCDMCNNDFEVKINNKKRLCSDECRIKWGKIKENKDKRILASKKSFFEKHGVDSIFKKNDFKNGLKKILVDKYGVDNPMKHEGSVTKLKNTLKEKQINNLLPKLEDNNLLLLDEYTANKSGTTSMPYNFKCLKCNNVFTSTVLGSGKIPICRKCFPLVKNSKLEAFIRDFLNENNIDHLDNSRKLLSGQEIDLLLHDYNLGIEVNCNFYHSEINGEKDRNYHINKSKLAHESNIKLVHIFEDEILYKKDIVLSRLSNFLMINNKKIYARKCSIMSVDKKVSDEFLNKNHIQDSSIDKIRLGLFYDNELVSLITFGKLRKIMGRSDKENQYELMRFVNKKNHRVVGGFSRLLKYFIDNYKPNKVITYADIRWSGLDYKNTVYYKNGFTFIENTPPNYWYVKMGEYNNRYHRFNFRKDVLVKEGFDNKLSEFEIMKIKGYDRIWDCGNMKFELNI